jgi:hypothetical protein
VDVYDTVYIWVRYRVYMGETSMGDWGGGFKLKVLIIHIGS